MMLKIPLPLLYMNTILVTGGAGFIGSHLCEYLLNTKTNRVICADNLITGSIDNITHFLTNENFEFVLADITVHVFTQKIDEIYHLACIASPVKYKQYSIETLDTSIRGTINMLNICKQQKCKMVFSSTSEIYGDPLVHPQSEEYYGNVNTIGERSCYDEGKRVAETLIYEYTKKFNLDTKIVRIFNTYGPKMNIDDGRIITEVIKHIKNDTTLNIYGDGTQTRSFCYISDMIDGLVKMMKSDEKGPINLGNPHCYFSINNLVAVFEHITTAVIKTKYLEKTENDPMCRQPVITKANEKLNWFPLVNLYEGISQTIKYMGR